MTLEEVVNGKWGLGYRKKEEDPYHIEAESFTTLSPAVT